MSYIDETWLVRAHRSLKAMFDVDRHTKQEMIQFLFDEGFWDAQTLSWDGAVARFNDCLNPQKPQFFKISEIWAMAMRFGRYQLFEAWAEDLGFEIRAVPTEARRLQVLERLAKSEEAILSEIAATRAQLDRLDTPLPDPRATVLPGQRAQFSKSEENTVPTTPVGRIGAC